MARLKHYNVAIIGRAIEILKRSTAGVANTLAGDRVYRRRHLPLSDDGSISAAFLPAICVYVESESKEDIDITQERRVDALVVECYATVPNEFQDAAGDFDDDVDVMVEQVQVVFRRDQTLEETLEWLKFKSIEWGFDKGADSQIEVAKVTFDAKYVYDITSTLPLDDFDDVGVTVEVGGVGAPLTSVVNLS